MTNTPEHKPVEFWRWVFPAFFEIARGCRSAIVDFCEGGSEDPLAEDRVREDVELEIANCVSSFVSGKTHDNASRHKPVLDIDLPCLLMDSSTLGHHHLIIDKEISWEQYQKLLKVLADCGIIEYGFYHASVNRGGSWVRVPWVTKEDKGNG